MPNVAERITEHVTWTVDGVDRLYLNAYGPRLQSEGGVVAFLRHRGHTIPSPALFGPITEAFKTGLRAWADQHGIPWVEFQKGERKDDVVQRYRDHFCGTHGVLCVGVPQERAKAWTATKQVQGRHLHFAYRWKSVCVNHAFNSRAVLLELLPTLYAQGLQNSLEGVPILESVSDPRALPI